MGLVVVGDQGPLDRCADHPVVPDAGVEREQPLDDPGPQPGGDAAAVAFEAELVLQGPDDRLDPLPQPVRKGPGGLLVLAGRADQRQAKVRAGEERLGVLVGQALVGDDGGAGTNRDVDGSTEMTETHRRLRHPGNSSVSLAEDICAAHIRDRLSCAIGSKAAAGR